MRSLLFLTQLFFMFAALTVSAARVKSTEFEIEFKFEQKNITFVEDTVKRVTIDKNCHLNAKNCRALQSLSKVSLRNVEIPLFGGQNSGSAICRSLPQTILVVGKNSAGHERSFCLFTDDSLVDSGTLSYFAQMNDCRRLHPKSPKKCI